MEHQDTLKLTEMQKEDLKCWLTLHSLELEEWPHWVELQRAVAKEFPALVYAYKTAKFYKNSLRSLAEVIPIDHTKWAEEHDRQSAGRTN